MKRRADTAALQAQAQIQEDDDVVHQQDGGGHNGDGGDPDRHRAADQMPSAGPAADEEEAPKSQRGRVIGGQELARDPGHDIIGAGQSQGRHPQGPQPLREPAGHDRLEGAADGSPEQHHLRDGKHPGKEKKGGDRVPMRGEHDPSAPARPGQHPGDADRAVGHQQKRLDVPRKFQHRKGSGVARGDPDQAEGQSGVPKKGAGHHPVRGPERLAAQAAENPKNQRQADIADPAVDEGRFLQRLDMPVVQAGAGRPGPTGERSSTDADQGEHAADEQPGDRGGDQEKKGPAAGRFDGGDFGRGSPFHGLKAGGLGRSVDHCVE